MCYEALEINASIYNGKLDLIIDDIESGKTRYRISFAVPERSRVERLIEELRERDIFAVEAEKDANWPEDNPIVVFYGHLQTGFVYKDEKLAVISESDIIGARSRKQRRSVKEKGKRISSFTDLKVGDFVVHQSHGIGVYDGIEQLKVEGIRKDYLKISYKDGGTLYIPTTSMDLIQNILARRKKP